MKELMEQYGELALEILGTVIVMGILMGVLGSGGMFLKFVYRVSQLAC